MTLFAALAGLLGNGLAQAAPAQEVKLPALWTTDAKSFLESGPTVADVQGNGHDSVVVAGREEIIALDGSGKELWRWRCKSRFMTYPAVLARPGTTSLIYAAETAGQLNCLDGAGTEVWHAQLKGGCMWTAAAIGDLGADGTSEVIQSDATGTVWAFDALTGKPLWQTTVKGQPASPAVGDIDGDGKPEVVVVTKEGMLVALQGEGKVKWERAIGGVCLDWATSAPVIFAASDGQARIAAASSDGQLYCLNGAGEIVWQQALRGAAASAISAGDFDLDGRADVFVITQLGVIYRFDEEGGRIWDIDMQGRTLAPGAIVDINNDGLLEYVLSTQNGHLLALNNRGETISDIQFDHRTINVTPAFGDLLPNTSGLEMALTGGESAKVLCLGTASSNKPLAQWTGYRGDPHNSGSWFGLAQSDAVSMVPQGLMWDQVLTGQPIRFAIHNPAPTDKPLKASAVCTSPEGTHQMVTGVVLGKRGELVMPLDAIAPGSYHFSWALTDADGHEAVSGVRDLVLEPFANDRALVERAQAALRASAADCGSILASSAAALRREAAALGDVLATVSPLIDAVPGADAVAQRLALDQSAALVARARGAQGMAEAVRGALALGPNTSLLAFEGTLWENRDIDRQLPKQIANPLRITRTLVPGEHDVVPVKLFNVMDHELLVRVRIEIPEGGPTVTPHRTVAVPTSLGKQAWDALPELDESMTLAVPSLSTREVWLDVDLGSTGPGEHAFTVKLEALNGAGVIGGAESPQDAPPPVSQVEVALKVLPFEMAPSSSFRMCTWAAPEGPQVDDLLAHGNNAFCAPLPDVQYDGQGQLKGSEYTKLDAILERLRGNDIIYLLQGIPALHGEMGSEPYRRDMKIYLDELVAHLAARGIDAEHFALYPVDEPGGAGWNAVNQVVALGKQVKAANPAVMLYVDGGGEGAMYEAMAQCVDVWCPSIYMLPEDSAEMKVMRTTGKMLWSYNCAYGFARPVGANIKDINVVAEFRNAALFAMRYGATGAGFWCYNLGGDPWQRNQLEYPLVYPGRTKPVTSRRWDAVREGIEDFRIATALRRRLDAGGPDAVSADARARITHVLNISLPRMIDESYLGLKFGVGRSGIDLANSDATVAAFRNELMACVASVCAPPAAAPGQ